MNRSQTASSLRRRAATRVGLGLALALAAPAARGATFDVAIVRDGAESADPAWLARVEAELARHLPDDATPSLVLDPRFDGDWTPAGAAAALDAALADPAIEAVLAPGYLATRAAAARDRLPKPVVSGFAQRPDLLRVGAVEEDRSLEPGLSLLIVDRGAGDETAAFRALVPFATVHLALDPALAGDVDLAALGATAGAEVATLPCAAAAACLAALPAGARAVLLGPLPRLSGGGREELIAGLGSRGVAAWSLRGPADVEAGAFGTSTPAIDEALVRRIGLALGRLARGETTADLPVRLALRPALLLNGRTAAALGIAVSRDTLLRTRVLEPDALRPPATPLDMAEVLRLARAGSTSLAIQGARTASAQEEAAIARSALLPQVWLDAAAGDTDAPLAFTTAGLTADQGVVGRVSARQMVWDDFAVGFARSAERLATGSRELEQAVALDVMTEAATAYLGLGLQHALYRVEVDNLLLTEELLEIARQRVDAGSASRSEVLFWEAQVAGSRSRVLQAESDVASADVALAQLLGLPQDSRWQPRAPDLDPAVFPFLGGLLDPEFDDPGRRPAWRRAFVQAALDASPDLRAAAEVVAAQEIRVGVTRRAFWLPSFFVDASYTAQLDDGDGVFEDLDDDHYAIFLGANYAPFEGFRKVHDARRAESDLSRDRSQRKLAEERVERLTRTALEQAEGSFGRIALRREAARAALASLELVRERYVEGVASSEAVFIAQSQWFSEDQRAVAALYEHLSDLTLLQRALSWFEDERSPEDNQALAGRIRAAMADGGTQP